MQNKKLSIVLGVVVLALVIWWVNRAPAHKEAVAPTPTPLVAQDEIQQEVDQLFLGNVGGEFSDIDKELDTLK